MAIKKLNPYLNFNGTAAKAIKLYEKALDAKTENVMPWTSPEGQPPTPETKDRIMHAVLHIGDGVVMVSDAPPGIPVTAGNNMHVTLDFDDAADMARRFDALSAGGRSRCRCRTRSGARSSAWSPTPTACRGCSTARRKRPEAAGTRGPLAVAPAGGLPSRACREAARFSIVRGCSLLMLAAPAFIAPAPASAADDKIRVLSETPQSTSRTSRRPCGTNAARLGASCPTPSFAINRNVMLVKTPKELTARRGKYLASRSRRCGPRAAASSPARSTWSCAACCSRTAKRSPTSKASGLDGRRFHLRRAGQG